MKGITKELSFNLLKTFLIGLIISIIVAKILDWNPFEYVLMIMYGFLFLPAALGVYLNLIESVRESTLYSALSFFLLPLIFGVFGGLLLGLPYLYVHLYYFLKFRDKTEFSIIAHKRISILFVFVPIAVLILIGIYFYHEHTREYKYDFYQGYVFDINEKPLSGVKVRENIPVYQETISDSDGYFKFRRDKESCYDLIFEKEGYTTDTIETVWFHPERGPVYNFLRTPGTITMMKDSIQALSPEDDGE